MAVINCSACGKAIKDTSQTCPYCRARVAHEPTEVRETPSGRRPGVLLVVVAAVLIGGYWLVSNVGSPGPRDLPPPEPTPPPASVGDMKFGLPLETRREAFQQIVRAGDHAQVEALRRFPEPGAAESPDAWQRRSDLREQFRKQVEEENKKAVAKRYGLTSEQLDALADEGFQKAWPQPPRKALR